MRRPRLSSTRSAPANRRIEIGGFRDDAEEDDDLHPGGIAFMHAEGHILAREQYLDGAGRTPEPPSLRIV